MLKKSLSLLMFLLLFGPLCFCQLMIPPVELAKKIFSSTEFKDKAKYSSGEYEGHPDGSDLAPDIHTSFSLLDQTEDKAVVNMTLSDTLGHGMDTYLFFVKEDKIWKLTAFRALAMTGIIAAVEKQMESFSDREVDSLITISKTDTVDRGFPKSRADFDFELGNARLTLAMDKDLIAYFNKHKADFEKLKDIAVAAQKKDTTDHEGRKDVTKGQEKELHKLLISSLHYGSYELGQNCLEFLIGGILDNTVGYIYVSDKKNVPIMTPNRIIMIKEIGNGWYLYKTT